MAEHWVRRRTNLVGSGSGPPCQVTGQPVSHGHVRCATSRPPRAASQPRAHPALCLTRRGQPCAPACQTPARSATRPATGPLSPSSPAPDRSRSRAPSRQPSVQSSTDSATAGYGLAPAARSQQPATWPSCQATTTPSWLNVGPPACPPGTRPPAGPVAGAGQDRSDLGRRVPVDAAWWHAPTASAERGGPVPPRRRP